MKISQVCPCYVKTYMVTVTVTVTVMENLSYQREMEEAKSLSRPPFAQHANAGPSDNNKDMMQHTIKCLCNMNLRSGP
jgi:hypothetical protein